MARNYVPKVTCDNCSSEITNGTRHVRKNVTLGDLKIVVDIKPLNEDTAGRFKPDLCEQCVFTATALAIGLEDRAGNNIDLGARVDEGNTPEAATA